MKNNVIELKQEIEQVKRRQVEGKMDPITAAIVVMELQASVIRELEAA